jgi:hypothetical protein
MTAMNPYAAALRGGTSAARVGPAVIAEGMVNSLISDGAVDEIDAFPALETVLAVIQEPVQAQLDSHGSVDDATMQHITRIAIDALRGGKLLTEQASR